LSSRFKAVVNFDYYVMWVSREEAVCVSVSRSISLSLCACEYVINETSRWNQGNRR